MKYLNIFKTQNEAKKHIRSIIQELPYGEVEKPEILKKILMFHIKYEEKMELFKCFIIEQDLYKNKRIRIIKTDNSSDTISYAQCCKTLEQQKKEQDSLFNLATSMRVAIKPQISEFRKNNIKYCSLCKNSNIILHVDHIYEFNLLMKDFLKDNMKYPTNFNKNKESSETIFKPEDIDFENKWVEYHKQKATLRILCASCNKKRLTKI